MKNRKIFIFIGMALLVYPIFFFRDLTPDNELKYISIVTEALDKGNIFAFYNHGIPYADKPPLYFWIIMMVKNITGSYSVPTIGMFSLLPALLILIIMSRWSSSELDEEDQTLASGMLFTTSIFLGGGLVLRMDMLMTLFIILSLYSFYRCYTGIGKSWEPYLIWLWIFLALFTKGPLGILIPLVSIIVFLTAEKKLSKIRQYLPLRGLIILVSLTVIWLSLVYFEGGKGYLYNLTVKQTVGRGVNSFKHKRPFYYYFTGSLASFLPWSLFYVTTFILGIKNRSNAGLLEKFFRTVVISTFILLSFISSKLEIYLLPAYPFVAFLSVLQFRRLSKEKYWKWCAALPGLLLFLIFPGIFAAAFLNKLPFEITFLFYSGLLFVSLAGIYSLLHIEKGNFKKSFWGIIFGMLFLIFSISMNLEDLNSEIGLKALAEKGQEIKSKKIASSFYAFNFEKSENMDVYLHEPVININDLDSLHKVIREKNIILFVRTKDIKRNQELKNTLSNFNKFKIGSNYLYQVSSEESEVIP
ncbi:glycosyltransferase family 39 protein [uncultured Ilyobacter sp.]|jgi:4-amino-4-deoxy-L-arabinose transferase-like glycosyltransferase|uniref:ArnT family glycosyltransferase n=1 Tax=uncultured Ilyobacter sp. TaxID=544433 RepID=UPI0029C066FA|nr:glycosyltransferase family 39 protein [uncultured Ilyobacter sp.]